jgi:hypothetical protein
MIEEQQVQNYVIDSRRGHRNRKAALPSLLQILTDDEIENWLVSSFTDTEVARLLLGIAIARQQKLSRAGFSKLVEKMTCDVRRITNGLVEDFAEFIPEYTASEVERAIDGVTFEANCVHPGGQSLLIDWKDYWAEYPTSEEIVKLALME